MGFNTSAYYKAQIIAIETQIEEERNLAGVARVENGEDQLDLEGRLKSLIDMKRYYEKQYNKALAKEGDYSGISFIPRMENGN